MKPWPTALTAKYPLPPAALTGSRETPHQCPERPWWTLVDVVRSPSGEPMFHKRVAWRRDGVTITQHGKDLLDAGPGFGQRKVPSQKQGGSWQAERLLLMAECDRKRPVAHPGFRVGQIWALPIPDREPVSLILTERTENVWYAGGAKHYISDDELKATLLGAFLVADPACPWLAPWAPAESA